MTETFDAAARRIAVPAPGTAHAYADGACSGNPGPGGWGAVVVSDAGVGQVFHGGDPATTNNRMELRAAAEGVSRAAALPGTKRVVLHVDSTYVKDGIKGWIVGWKRNGWRTSAGQPVKNQELWMALDAACAAARAAGVEVGFEWVKGHAGHPGNEAADAAARAGIAEVRGGARGRAAGILAVALTALVMAQGAKAQPLGGFTPAPQPSLSAPVQGGFVVSGGQPGDWAFMMGPTGSPAMQMKLMRANADRSGAVGFMCARATGEMQLAVALPGASFEVGKPRDLSVTVGDRTDKLSVVVSSRPEDPAVPVFEANGLAVPEILKGMGEVADTRLDARLTFDDGEGHKATFGLTRPHGVAATASEVCAGWALAVQNAAPRPDAPVPAPVLPDETRRPAPPTGGLNQAR